MDFLEFITTAFFADHLASKQEEQKEWERLHPKIEDLRSKMDRLKRDLENGTVRHSSRQEE